MAGLAEEGRQKATAESLPSRVGKMKGVDFSSGWLNYIVILPDKGHRCWAGSLVEHLMGAGLYVVRHGEPMPMQDKLVHRLLQLSGPESIALWSRGVRVMIDPVRHTMAAAAGHIPAAMPWLKSRLLSPPATVASMIQRGLCWRFTVKLLPVNRGKLQKSLDGSEMGLYGW